MKKNVSKDLSVQAKAVWQEKTIEGKTSKLRDMLKDCRFQANICKFERELDTPNLTTTRLDFIASSLMLCDTDKVIKI